MAVKVGVMAVKVGILCAFSAIVVAQQQPLSVLTPPYFNIAENRPIKANATCGEGGNIQKEVYCKLVGFDRLDEDVKNFDIIDGQVCDECFPYKQGDSSVDFFKTHPASNAVDGDINTHWQSPPISRGRKYNRIDVDIDLIQEFQVAYIVVTMADSPRPGVWALEKSSDYGKTYTPWQYFASNDAECQKYFGIHANVPISVDDSVICSTEFSKTPPFEGGEVFVALTSGRPSERDIQSSDVMMEWLRATNIRMRLMHTKTMLGHLMSVAQGDKTVTRRYYYSIKEISVGGRCICNGHAFVCPADRDDPLRLTCICNHETAGDMCNVCRDGFTQKKWRKYTKEDPFECEACNCNAHSTKCYYNATVDEMNMSMDLNGDMIGGGVCEDCQHFTTGINCDTCVDGYYRPPGVKPNATDPCRPCDCSSDPYDRYTGNCEAATGVCECKENFRGNLECSACASGYYDYPLCKPCDCYAHGTKLDANGIPTCVADDNYQCPCKRGFGGAFCDECADTYWNFPSCQFCGCDFESSENLICNKDDGQCVCNLQFGGKTCSECAHGFYNYKECLACNCDPVGSELEICTKSQTETKYAGECICKAGFAGDRCDKCEDGWFGYPDCQPCGCEERGSQGRVCNVETGQCQCFSQFGGRKCEQCSPGFYGYPLCDACNCQNYGSVGDSCNDDGVCTCKPNFMDDKCSKCVPNRFNFPQCEECNCNPNGVAQDFFKQGGCANVAPGELCSCKKRVEGRTCDTCMPLFWDLQAWNPQGCSDCNCFRPGTLGNLGTCDLVDGHCGCKLAVSVELSKKCDQCLDGFYQLSANNMIGCDSCDCDTGGTEYPHGQEPLCDKMSGTCPCKMGMTGRRCNEVEAGYYVPTLYQYKFEIEDGYRRNGAPVIFAYDTSEFPNFSWRGYASYSPLQTEVLQDIDIMRQATYRMVLNVQNPQDSSSLGTVTIRPYGSMEGDDAEKSYKVVLEPTQGNPNLMTVKGELDNFPSPFGLEPGRWTVSINIENTNSDKAILIDYYVLLPYEYVEPTILKENIQNPCIRSKQSESEDNYSHNEAFCREFTFPHQLINSFPSGYANYSMRPRGVTEVFQYTGDLDEAAQLGLEQHTIAEIARWQPELNWDIYVEQAGPHVLSIIYFTPKSNNGAELFASLRDQGSEVDIDPEGQAYIYDCPYSTLCRQVVTTPDGQVATFYVDTPGTTKNVKILARDPDAQVAIERVVLVPLSSWSMDYVAPVSHCVKDTKTRACLPSKYPVAPADSTLILMSDNNPDKVASELPRGIYQAPTATGDSITPPLVKLNEANPMVDISGTPQIPGNHVLMAHYYQPDHPLINVPILITEKPEIRPGGDQITELADIKVYEAVLPLPTCASNTGCKAVAYHKKDPNQKDFMITETLNIQFQHPGGPDGVWIEYITAVPSNDWNEDLLKPDKIEQASNFVKECSSNNFYIDPSTPDGFCKESVTSLTAQFNQGALQCACNPDGANNPTTCQRFGGQCECKENVIGQSCSRCAPNFFGFPDCKPCQCPDTATCNEQTGDCICAPFVEGPDDNPCTECMENTFGYNPITGCQECNCQVEGTVGYNMSCSLDSGLCNCNANIEGRTCDHCTYGSYRYPNCELCDCQLDGTEEKICNQDTAECYCKNNVQEGGRCDTCQEGTFNLQADNPDGCTDCFCFGKTLFCSSSENMQRTQITDMEGWTPVTFTIDKAITMKDLAMDPITDEGNGVLSVFQFDPSYHNLPAVNILYDIFYFRGPVAYTGHQIKSYGGNLKYSLLYDGDTTMNQGTKKSPDVILVGGGMSLLHYSGIKIKSGVLATVKVPMEPRFWIQITGAPVDRPMLMKAINSLEGLYIRGSYSSDHTSYATLSNVILDSAITVAEVWGDLVTSVEQCLCPEGYYGTSCQMCDRGYFASTIDMFGPVCEPCNCHGHAAKCHPTTGECVLFVPSASQLTRPLESITAEGDNGTRGMDGDYDYYDYEGESVDWCEVAGMSKEECEKIGLVTKVWFDKHNISKEDRSPSLYCHFNPDECFVPSTDVTERNWRSEYAVCGGHSTGKQCEKCIEGYYGDATEGYEDSCKACPCPGPGPQNFAKSCDSFMGNNPDDYYCECKEHYVGRYCSSCGSGYYGNPRVEGDYCKPCSCNGNINTTDPEACDNISGLCEKCLYDTEGANCEHCRKWTFGDAIDIKDCKECDCNRDGTEFCDDRTGKCHCFEGVEGERCNKCQADHWGFEFGGCTPCECSEASIVTQCSSEDGQCDCKPGVIGQKCDRCLNGFWNLGTEGCQECTCNTDYAVGGGCNQGTGQCECLPGVIGRDCDQCPPDWLLISNENRTVIPEWKRVFSYQEGCFECPSCMSDLMDHARNLSNKLAPIREEFREAESSVYAFKRLKYVEEEIERLRPEISLLDPVEGNKRMQPLEDSLNDAHLKSKALNIEYKLSLTKDLSNEALKLEEEGSKTVDQMGKVGIGVLAVIKDVNEIEEGLGIGFSKILMETSIEKGKELLAAMKKRDFNKTRQRSMEEQLKSSEQWNEVKLWTSPAEDFKKEVAATEEKLDAFDRSILDIKKNAETAKEMAMDANKENWENVKPKAKDKIDSINNLLEETKAYHNQGDKLVSDSDQYIVEAKQAYGSLGSRKEYIDSKVVELEDRSTKFNASKEENFVLGRNANLKAAELESQATTLSNILDRSKVPAERALHAATAYENILKAMEAARVAKEEAFEDALKAANMTVGLRKKVDNSVKSIQMINGGAERARDDLKFELDTDLVKSKQQVEWVDEKTKQIKQGLETITKNVELIKDLSGTLSQTKADATKAQTDAHDQLASINARATQIHNNMDDARVLQNTYDAMKFNLNSAEQSIERIENPDSANFDRVKRNAEPDTEENVNRRLDRLTAVRDSNDDHGTKISDLLKSIKEKVAVARNQLSDMKPGITFSRGSSHLELKNPDNFEELATKTGVSFYVNVSKNSGQDDRAFLFYMGNLDETYKLIPGVITDDFMALQVITGGLVKLTMDLGAGAIDLISSKPVDYNQWNQIVVNREGHLVSLTVRSEAGEGEVTESSVNRTLPFADQHGKPFGSVFNLHPEFSKIFVGGFPTDTKIQQVVRSTDLQGQVEGLKIGGKSIGLWNYRNAGALEGSTSRDKFIQEEGGRQFRGNGFVSIDQEAYFFEGQEITNFKMRFRAEKGTGLIFLTGNETGSDFIALQLKDSYISYSYDLGSGPVEIRSTSTIELNVWYLVEMKRTGNNGELLVNGVSQGVGGTQEGSGMNAERTVVPYTMGDFYVGGYFIPPPFHGVTDISFTGCVKEFMLGSDYLFSTFKEERSVTPGCKLEVENQVSFQPGTPGFVQLPTKSANGSIEFSFMFRTTASHGLLYYMTTIEPEFYYVSLSMKEGSLHLYTFPGTIIVTETAQGSERRLVYNDNKWHVVSVMITTVPQNMVYLYIDDINSFKMQPENIFGLMLDYRVYLGGTPDDMVLRDEVAAIKTPFAGCIRDAIVMQEYINFKNSVNIQGASMGECGVAMISTTESPEEPETKPESIEELTTTPAPYDPVKIFGEIQEEGPYGSCALPIRPGYDPDLTNESGFRFGTKSNCYIEYKKKLKIKKRGKFSLEFKTSFPDGLIFYTKDDRQNSLQRNVIALFVKGGKLIYSFNCGSGYSKLETGFSVNDDKWHLVVFSREFNEGKLVLDGTEVKVPEHNRFSQGETKYLEVSPELWIGGLPKELKEDPDIGQAIKKDLEFIDKTFVPGFIGCIRNFEIKGRPSGKWSRKQHVIPCSENVERGFFFGSKSGRIRAYPKYRVGLDFDITMWIKPRNVTGLLLAVQGRRDYCILEMVDGEIIFRVDNGRGPITATFKPTDDPSHFCNGEWHELHAVKAKNVVTLSVDKIFAQPGIGVPGVSSTDTNHPLFIGGHARPGRLTRMSADSNFVGCVRDVSIESNDLVITDDMLYGDITAHVCPLY